MHQPSDPFPAAFCIKKLEKRGGFIYNGNGKEALFMPYDEIDAITQCFVKALSPRRVYLFGSFADGTNTEDSDFDFYIVVDKIQTEPADVILEAYKSIRALRKRPVDILVGTESNFEERKNRSTIEGEVFRKGVLLYAA